jgi:hypothetical protein
MAGHDYQAIASTDAGLAGHPSVAGAEAYGVPTNRRDAAAIVQPLFPRPRPRQCRARGAVGYGLGVRLATQDSQDYPLDKCREISRRGRVRGRTQWVCRDRLLRLNFRGPLASHAELGGQTAGDVSGRSSRSARR